MSRYKKEMKSGDKKIYRTHYRRSSFFNQNVNIIIIRRIPLRDGARNDGRQLDNKTRETASGVADNIIIYADNILYSFQYSQMELSVYTYILSR